MTYLFVFRDISEYPELFREAAGRLAIVEKIGLSHRYPVWIMYITSAPGHPFCIFIFELDGCAVP